ncbi:MAG: hypothetical protein CVV47_16205 [Spirochaetae bacterium HGW-Spirochaetae-3]|jgi:DNA-binding transcriptional MerR regulator|nr:MAG: hypothetical protein CVV47_16205 [Spirochaetae bacterium HGW-Spirochaetae-3]
MKYKIGSFRRWTGLTEGALRYYEELGLIRPFRDLGNDYRYYDELNFLQLLQVKQLSSFDIQLGDLPCDERAVSIEDMRMVLARRQAALEAEINELYDRLARIKLHESFFGQSYPDVAGIQKANIRGIYRLFISDPAVAEHPASEEIARSWISRMPYAHATLRIPLQDLLSQSDGPYPVQVGIGMLERYFSESGDTFREPMQYSAPNTSVSGTISVGDLRRITREDLEPILGYIQENNLLPCDDMFGWIVYIARSGAETKYHLSLRVAVA